MQIANREKRPAFGSMSEHSNASVCAGRVTARVWRRSCRKRAYVRVAQTLPGLALADRARVAPSHLLYRAEAEIPTVQIFANTQDFIAPIATRRRRKIVGSRNAAKIAASESEFRTVAWAKIFAEPIRRRQMNDY